LQERSQMSLAGAVIHPIAKWIRESLLPGVSKHPVLISAVVVSISSLNIIAYSSKTFHQWTLDMLGLSPKVQSLITFDDVCYGGLLFAEVLHTHQVKFVFTLTGGHIAPILVGCREKNIRVIDVRHEANAVFAADAVSRLSGIPGVAIVTAGPGLTNTITAVKNAQMAQSPLIVIGGATSDLLKGRGSLQDIDQVALMKPHVKWIAHISSVGDIVPILENAFRISKEDVPGPVFVEVPLDLLYRKSNVEKFYSAMMTRSNSLVGILTNWYLRRRLNQMFNVSTVPVHVPFDVHCRIASSKQVSKVANLLANSKCPLIMLGSQTAIPAKCELLVEALKKIGIPTLLSGMARGLLGRNSSLHIRHKDSRKKALRETDVVILAGVPLDFRVDYGRSISNKATLIMVNWDTTELNKNRSPSLALHADPCEFVLQLSSLLSNGTLDEWKPWLKELSELDVVKDQQIANDCEKQEPSTESSSSSSLETLSSRVNPLFLCKQIDELAAERSIFIGDGGDFVGTAAYVLRPRGPLCWLDPGAFGTLGVGCGFALGAKLCKPESQVWILFGDGACGFSLIEFDTFVRHNIPVIGVVGNDACWMQMLRGQMEFFQDDVGCNLALTDYQNAVKGLGAEGILVKETRELEPALKTAIEFASKVPVLVNVHISRTQFRAGSLSM